MEHLVKVLKGRGTLIIGSNGDLSFLESEDAGLKGHGMIAADPSLLRSAAHADDIKLRTSEGMVVELAIAYVHADTNSADVEVRGKSQPRRLI